jgi:hypothetical protein
VSLFSISQGQPPTLASRVDALRPCARQDAPGSFFGLVSLNECDYYRAAMLNRIFIEVQLVMGQSFDKSFLQRPTYGHSCRRSAGTQDCCAKDCSGDYRPHTGHQQTRRCRTERGAAGNAHCSANSSSHRRAHPWLLSVRGRHTVLDILFAHTRRQEGNPVIRNSQRVKLLNSLHGFLACSKYSGDCLHARVLLKFSTNL